MRKRIWVIKTGENIPYLEDERGDRAGRACQVAQALQEAGHDVVWFNALFSHYSKSFRNEKSNSLIDTGPGLPDLVLLRSSGYKSHIGLKRLFDHFELFLSFRKVSKQLEKPDLIFCAYPTVELSYAASQFGKRYNIPVVIDVRDLWPDIIYERLNSKLSKVKINCNGMLLPYEYMAKKAFSDVNGITAVTESILDWAQSRFNRPKNLHENDRPFYQSLAPNFDDNGICAKTWSAWEEKGLATVSSIVRFVWVGNISSETDGRTLLEALYKLSPEHYSDLEVVICGLGSMQVEFQTAAEELPFLKVIGWVKHDDLTALLQNSHVGLLCYLDRPDFHMSVPNKVVDYCRASMRILTNLDGELTKLAQGSDVVLNYRTGDVCSLTDLITHIISKKKYYQQKPERSQDLFDRYFNSEKSLKEIVLYLEQLTQS